MKHYPTFSCKQLQSTVEPHTAVDIETTESGAILATEQGARLLGLFPVADLPNVLWVHEEVGRLMGEGQWMVGGERQWIAPERGFYYENPRDFAGFHVPADIDPSNYLRTADMSYESQFSLLDLWTNEVYDDCLARRSFKPISDPYNTGLAYAGARISDSIQVHSTSLAFCSWTVSMVYTCGSAARGTALFPIRPKGQLISYFDPIPADRADIPGTYARFLIDGEAVYKLAIAPEDIAFENRCKGVYISPYPCLDTWFCVVKRGDDLPRTQADCVDQARGNPDGHRGAIQSYNNGSRDAGVEDCPFGEIELQQSRGISNGIHSTSAGTHELLAYAGSMEEMLDVAKAALMLDKRPRIY